MWLFCLVGFLILVWVVFFGGVEKLEGMFLGYFEFGYFVDKVFYICVVLLISMVLFVFGFFYEVVVWLSVLCLNMMSGGSWIKFLFVFYFNLFVVLGVM